MAYIVEHPDLELVDSYADDGFDGVALQRPGFLEILDGIMAGEIDCIVADDICRISSNMLELAYIMTDILPEMDGQLIFSEVTVENDADNNRGLCSLIDVMKSYVESKTDGIAPTFNVRIGYDG